MTGRPVSVISLRSGRQLDAYPGADLVEGAGLRPSRGRLTKVPRLAEEFGSMSTGG